MTVRLLLLGLAAALAPALQAQTEDAEAAAAHLEPLLREPAILAATAALLHAETGRYPDTPFALLGSPTASTTGARRLRLAELDLQPDADTLRVLFLLTPTAAHPTERLGGFSLTRDADGPGYTARFRIAHRDDPDFGGGELPVTEAGQLVVRTARGRLCLDLDRLQRTAAAGTLADEAPFLDADRAITIAFTTTRGGQTVDEVTLHADAIP